MSTNIASFINTWSPSFKSTLDRIEARNVRQGGNGLLAALPEASQAMWAGSVVSRVSEVAQGPIKWIATTFSILFHPLVALPLSVLSCAVKERCYESSVTARLLEQTHYFERGAEVPEPILGTISLVIHGQRRHFILGQAITRQIENSILIDEDGERKRYLYRRLQPEEAFDARCRQVEINGVQERIRLNGELSGEDSNYIEITLNGRKSYFKINNEVAQPIAGTVTPQNVWPRRHYLIGNPIQVEAPNCIQIHAQSMILHYETGNELAAPVPGSRCFVINGQTRHFASAKFITSPSLGLSGVINRIPKLPFRLPTRLGRFTVQVFEWTNQHMSQLIRVVIAISGVYFAVLGQFYMAAGALLAVTYEYLDHDLGVIPTKVSLIMEKWMPTISLIGLAIVGSPFSQLLSVASLLLMNPSFRLFMHHKVSKGVRSILMHSRDAITHRFMQNTPNDREMVRSLSSLPSLEEYDAPLIENKSLNKRQIDALLAAEEDAYEVNPAHYTKTAQVLLNLPENRNFNELTRLWNGIGARWLQQDAFSRLLARLVDDKRFILFLKNRFPEAKRFIYEDDWYLGHQENQDRYRELQAVHRNQMEEWVQIWAQEGGRTKQEFVADWVKQQLQFFVDKLSGARPREGSQQMLADAAERTAQIIPFLTRPAATVVDVEDALVKLAIEGGDYCALAMWRVSGEVLDGFTEPLQVQALQGADPQKAFEAEVRLALQRTRLQIVQKIFQFISQIFQQRGELRDTGEDIHLYIVYTQALKRTFYPMSPSELDKFGLGELLIKESILLLAQFDMERMYKNQLPLNMNHLGIDRLNQMRNRVLEYLRTWVNQNNSLTAAEKEELLNGALSNDENHLIDHENYPKWNRLMLFVLGILRKKANP